MIQIFVTGGTFDKEYDLINGSLYFRDTHIPGILNRGRSNLDVNIRTLMMMDSLEMQDVELDYMTISMASEIVQSIIGAEFQ